MHRTLITGLNDPISVVVHPLKGYLFYSEGKRPSKIWKCYGDGTNCGIIKDKSLGRPNGLTIDFERDEICWSDSIGCFFQLPIGKFK